MPRPPFSISPLFTLAAFLVAVLALIFARDILIPLALAVLLSFVLTPIAVRLERLGLSRLLSVVLTAFFALAILLGLAWIVASQAIELSRELPTFKENIVAKVRAIAPSSKTFHRLTDAVTEMNQAITGGESSEESRVGINSQTTNGEKPKPSAGQGAKPAGGVSTESVRPDQGVAVHLVPPAPNPLTIAQDLLGPVVGPLTTVGMVSVLVLFMLTTREEHRNRLIRLFGAPNLLATTAALNDMSERISRYLRMQALINAGYGLLVGGGLWLIGVPNAPLWGVLSFALRFLPYIGAWIAAAMPIGISMAVSAGWSQPIFVIAWFVLLEVIAGNVVEPLIYGRSIGVSGLGIILAAIFWTWVWGPVGLILAVPLTVCLVVTAQYIPQLRFIAVLIGDEPALTLTERIYQRLLTFDDHEPRKLVDSYLEDHSAGELYDDLLVRVLLLAGRDRNSDLLTDDQQEFIEDAVEELARDEAAPGKEEPSQPRETDAAGQTPQPHWAMRIACLPVRDRSDQISAQMLGGLLKTANIDTVVGSPDSLTTEIVELVSAKHIDVVVITMLSPLAPRKTRLLWRRLRDRYPQLPIVVACWGCDASNPIARQFAEADRGFFAASMQEATSATRQAATIAGMAQSESAQHA
jgi:predicted PurR-regulated permease PerM